MTGNSVRGRFVWHELVTPNAQGAHEFYSKAVGWKTQGWEQDSSYQMFVASTGPIGATVEKRDDVPLWVPYVGSDDVDATVETAKRLGAKVVTEPTTLPNAGRYALLADPNGATFGLHGAGGEPSAENEAQHGEFSWHDLATAVDPSEAFGFYQELFGWEDLAHHDMGPMGTYLLFGRNGVQLGGMYKKGDAGKPGPAYWLGYVRTPNVDKMAEDVKAARGIVLLAPDAVSGGHRIAQFEDPHGAFFAGHTLAQDVTAAPQRKAPKAVTARSESPAKAPDGTARARKAGKAAAAQTPTPQPTAASKTSNKTSKKTATKVAKKAGKKTAAKPAKKAAKKTAKKASKKAPKKAPKKTPKKTSRKPAKKAANKKVANKKAARKPARKAARPAKRKAKRR